jgi:putative tricarboxylic transport membrane protein
VQVFNDLANGFALALTPENLAAALIGALIGTAVGVLPGMSPTAAMAIFLAPTIGLKPETGLIVLGAMFYGSQYGDSMTAILMNVPSEAASVVISTDGYQMTRRGRAGAALSSAAVASFVGATVGLVGLMLFGPLLSAVAVLFGPADYFDIALFALLLLARIASGSVWKGLLMMGLGLAVTTVGIDPLTGVARFTFGKVVLTQGIELVPVVVGLFGMAELFELTSRAGAFPTIAKLRFREIFPTLAEWFEAVPAMARGAGIGFFLGLLPGPTLTLATFVSYALEKRLPKGLVEFGKGAIRGVAGPKAADDAAVSGNLVPLLALGLPFSPVTAVLFAGLLLHGIQPGPLLITQHANIFWGFIAAMYVGNVALLILNFPLVGIWINLLRIRTPVLLSLLMILMFVGVFGYRNSTLDLIVLLVSGLVGYALKQLRFDRTILVLGLVLGPLLETSLREALFISRGNPVVFAARPVGVVVVLGLLLVFALPRVMGRMMPQIPPAELDM